MLVRMKENLDRQHKGILLLRTLLREEFSLLRKGESQSVSRLELSIQELMRQLMIERISLRKMVRSANQGARRLADLYDVMPADAAEHFKSMLSSIDSLEQQCARQADQNRELALGLHEQSSSLLEFIHEKIQPRQNNVYSNRGRFTRTQPQAALLNGRF